MKIVFLFLILFLSQGNVFAHQWMMDFLADDGIPCCSFKDCREVKVQVIEVHGKTWTVNVEGNVFTLESKAVYPSEDERTYFCHNGYMRAAYNDSLIGSEAAPTDPCIEGEISKRCFRCLFYGAGS